MKNKRQLKNMDIEEVSLVDRPANKRKFLLIKREDEITELTIKTDGTFDGTTLSVNGTAVNDLKSFWFSLWPPDDFDEGVMMGSYTVTETDGAEFDQEATFHLKKGMNTMKLEAVLKAMGIDPNSLSPERTQDLEALIKFIPLMPPEDGERAFNVLKASLVKEEAPAAEEEDEPTPEEATVAPEKVAEIKAAMALLNENLPESERSVLKTEEPDKMGLVLAAIAELKKKDGDPPADKKTDPPETEGDILKSLIKRLSVVEKTTGVPVDSEDEDETSGSEIEAYDKLTKEEKLKKYGTIYGRTQANMSFNLKEFLEG